MPDLKRAYHHGDLAYALLRAGLDVLEAQGDVALRDIARRVGVAPNAVYRHYASKEDLLVALARFGFGKLADTQHRALSSGPAMPANALRIAAGAYVRFARANPALFRLMFDRFAGGNGNAELTEAYDETLRTFEYLIRAVAPAGTADSDVETAVVLAWSLVHGLSVLVLDHHVARNERSLDALVDDVLALAVHAIGA